MAHAPRLPAPGETVLGSDVTEHAGGKGLNQAVAAARAGVRTSFIGAVGADAAGDRLVDELAASGVLTSGVRRSSRPTGRAIITVDDAGENSIVVVMGANADVEVGWLPPAKVVLAQLEVPVRTVAAAFRMARAAGAVTVLNPAPAGALDRAVLALVDVLVPNEHELAGLGPVEDLIVLGVRAVVTTLGARGARVVTAESEWHVPPFPVAPVDTTGAGDAFCGVLAARLATGDPLDVAVRAAAAAGALATTRQGAVPSMPTASEIAALLHTR